MKGKRKFYRRTNRAALKVSFFGPFGGYNVIALDREYHALVCTTATTCDTLRTPTISDEETDAGVATRRFDVSKLIWVQQPMLMSAEFRPIPLRLTPDSPGARVSGSPAAQCR